MPLRKGTFMHPRQSILENSKSLGVHARSRHDKNEIRVRRNSSESIRPRILVAIAAIVFFEIGYH
jgi:hypothetical protein